MKTKFIVCLAAVLLICTCFVSCGYTPDGSTQDKINQKESANEPRQ